MNQVPSVCKGLWEELLTKMAPEAENVTYLNEMRKYFESNSRTKEFAAHSSKVTNTLTYLIVRMIVYGESSIKAEPAKIPKF